MFLVEYGPEGCPAETNDIRVTRHRDTCLIFHLTQPISFDTAQETCRNHFNGRMLTIRDSIKMDFVASVLSGLGMEANSETSHNTVWLGLSYSYQWRWTALSGMYYAWYVSCPDLEGGQGSVPPLLLKIFSYLMEKSLTHFSNLENYSCL